MGELSSLLGLKPAALKDLSSLADSLYCVYPIKSHTKTRWIEAPAPRLKMIQRKLLEGLLYQLHPTDFAHGFVPKRSILTHAAQHERKAWVVTMDIRHFFPSVRGALLSALWPDFGLTRPAAAIVHNLVTRKDHLPQGAPTSPHLGNLVLRQMDIELALMAEHRGWAYSRYADDLAFSGAMQARDIAREAAVIVKRHGFRVSAKKTHIMGRHQRQHITGLVVNEGISVPRELRRRLRAIDHQMLEGGELCGVQEDELRVAGQFAYARHVQRMGGRGYGTAPGRLKEMPK